jgi:hypothetical protein
MQKFAIALLLTICGLALTVSAVFADGSPPKW